MQTKDYYISILKGPFVQQLDIPNAYLNDNEIMQYIYTYKWAVSQQNVVTGWSTLTKSIAIYD